MAADENIGNINSYHVLKLLLFEQIEGRKTLILRPSFWLSAYADIFKADAFHLLWIINITQIHNLRLLKAIFQAL